MVMYVHPSSLLATRTKTALKSPSKKMPEIGNHRTSNFSFKTRTDGSIDAFGVLLQGSASWTPEQGPNTPGKWGPPEPATWMQAPASTVWRSFLRFLVTPLIAKTRTASYETEPLGIRGILGIEETNASVQLLYLKPLSH